MRNFKFTICFLAGFLISAVFIYHTWQNDSQNDGRLLGAKTESEERIGGGVIPHHLPAEKMINEFFARFTDSEIETVLLIGPNHKPEISYPILTLENDYPLVQFLIASGLARGDNMAIASEHSIGSAVPGILKYLPGAKIVPLVVDNSLGLEKIENLTRALLEKIDEKTLVVAAVDFSHHVTADGAVRNDLITLEAMRGFELEKILTFGNEYLDSPVSITLLLNLMEKRGLSNLRVLDHGDSSQFEKTANGITSYFSIVFE